MTQQLLSGWQLVLSGWICFGICGSLWGQAPERLDRADSKADSSLLAQQTEGPQWHGREFPAFGAFEIDHPPCREAGLEDPHGDFVNLFPRCVRNGCQAPFQNVQCV